MFDNKIEKL